MKVALIIKESRGIPSFYASKNKAHFFKNDKIYTGATQNPYVLRNIWNIPLALNGYHINVDESPKIDIDLILAVNDLGKPHFTNHLRKKFPNAAIAAYTKEWHPSKKITNKFISFLNSCDVVVSPFQHKYLTLLQKAINKPIMSLPYPYPIQILKKNYYTQAKNGIFIGCNPNRCYKSTKIFSQWLSKKLDAPLISHDFNLSFDDWMKQLSKSKYCINLDNEIRVGQTPIECAAVGTCHIGGISDSSNYLWGKLSTNNVIDLKNLINNIENKSNQYNKDAYKLLNKRYSYEASKNNIENIWKAIN